jgi:ANTAR domain-containing protein
MMLRSVHLRQLLSNVDWLFFEGSREYMCRLNSLETRLECASLIAHRLQSNWNDHVARFGNADQAIDAVATTDAALSERANPFTRTQIHVAAGMVAIHLRVNPDEAVDRLRAYSYACRRRVSSVAADIVARRLTLPDEPGLARRMTIRPAACPLLAAASTPSRLFSVPSEVPGTRRHDAVA